MKKKKSKIPGHARPAPKTPGYKQVIAWILSVWMVIFPFITYMKVNTLTGKTAEIFPAIQGYSVDFFLYYKEISLIFLILIIAAFFIGEHIFPDSVIKDVPIRRKENRVILILVGGYALMILLSAIFSANKESVMLGSPGEYEGLWALIGYCVIFLAGMNYINTKKNIRIFMGAAAVLMCIIVVLALIEFLYKPIFEIPFFQSVIAPAKFGEYVKSLKNEMFKGMVALTFYNPNYFGGFCALLFPLSVIMIRLANFKIAKFGAILLSGMLLIAVILSRSTAGLYGVFIAAAILGIIYRKLLIKNIKAIAVYCGILIAASILMNAASGGLFMKAATKTLLNRAPGESAEPAEKFQIKSIELSEGQLILSGEADSLHVTASQTAGAPDSGISFRNEAGAAIIPQKGDSKYTFEEPEFRAVSWRISDNVISFDLGYDQAVSFYVTSAGIKGIGQNAAVIDDVSTIEKRIFERYYGVATGRGYAWSGTLPLLKDTIIIGRGPGNFALYFPQNDYAGLLNTHGSAYFFIDKPHNMYLQIAVNTGIISLLLVLGIFFFAIKRGIKGFIIPGIREDMDFAADVYAGIFAGVAAFMVVGIINDSIVTTAPIFWLFLGMCVAAQANRCGAAQANRSGAGPHGPNRSAHSFFEGD